MMITRTLLICLLLALMGTPSSMAEETSSDRKPNFIFVLSDDIAQGDLESMDRNLLKRLGWTRLPTRGLDSTRPIAGRVFVLRVDRLSSRGFTVGIAQYEEISKLLLMASFRCPTKR